MPTPEAENLARQDPNVQKIAIFDIDGTLTVEDMLLLRYIDDQNIQGHLNDNTGELAEAMSAMKEGVESDEYEHLLANLLTAHAWALRGEFEDEVEAHAKEFYSQDDLWLPCMKPLFAELRDRNYKTILNSGGPQIGVAAVGKYFKVNAAHGSIYETAICKDTGKLRFTGKIESLLATSEKKGELSEIFVSSHSHIGSLALGNTKGDQGMFKSVEHPILVRPTESLLEIAPQRSRVIPEEELQNKKEAPATVLECLDSQQHNSLQTQVKA